MLNNAIGATATGNLAGSVALTAMEKVLPQLNITDPTAQTAYVHLAARAVRAGGVVVLGTFAPDGPTACSGLPTARHDADSLAALFADYFELVSSERDEHTTPWGAVQPFTWVTLSRRP